MTNPTLRAAARPHGMARRAPGLLAATALALGLLPATGWSQLAPGGRGAASQLSTRLGTPAPRQEAADFIIAVVNSEPITAHEVRTRLVRLEQQLARQGGALPPRSELAPQVLERLIGERVQLQLARELGIKVDDAAVDQAELSVARQNQIDRAELRQRLARDDISVAQFREDLRHQLTLTRLRERELEARVTVTEQDIDQYIREQQGGDPSAIELNLQQVLVAVPEGASPAEVQQRQARAARVAERARAGEDFTALVREFSDAPGARDNRGEFGLRPADRYPALFTEATRTLAAGGIAGPLRSDAGFHILRVVEKRQASLPGMTVTQSRARHILLRPGPQLSESAARERLADFRRRVLARQADFAALAREFSQDGSARNGGDLGWASPGQFVPEFEEVMNGLQPGQISEPLISRFGVHLIQLLERRETTLSAREQREIVRNLVREKKLDEAYQTWAEELRGRAYVELREPPR